MARRALFVDGEPARLGARAFDVLAVLIERRERLVSKSELLDVVWPDLAVEENNLQVQISALRKLLGADVIATVPGRGYKFTAALEGDPAAVPVVPEKASLPTARVEVRTPGNLAVDVAPLYGRELDVQAVQRQVLEHRLVTIAGAGGIGKTRAGLAVARALNGGFTDGVWVIELAPLADEQLVAASVAQVLGHQLRSTGAPLAELVTLLESQRLLLLIDNCEHLVGAVSQLAQAVLDNAPGVHMLVTSQEALRLPGERLYRLGTLGVPGRDDAVSPAQALQFGAVRLFVARVQALDGRFALDERNLRSVIDICRELDGLALAIEMAAARVPALGVQGVRERLGERLRMLTAGSRIALRRHQTLRAALDWSHGLLAEQDQVVFRRLAVFRGGCTIEAAQQVAGDEQLDEWTVLDAIGRLVDKSLIVADGEDKPRYRMLESARAYALEKLAAAQETDVLERRHATFCASYFRRLGVALFASRGTEDRFIEARVAEFDNLRAALKWALGGDGNPAIALALLGWSSPHAFLAASRAESEAWLAALEVRLASVELSQRQAALLRVTQMSWGFMTAWLSKAGVDAFGSWSIARQALAPLGRRRLAYFASHWALVHGLRGDSDAARAVLEEARALERPYWPAWLPALRLASGIRMAHWAGEFAGEISEIPLVLARLERQGDGQGRAAFRIRTHLAEDDLTQGRLEEGAAQLVALAHRGRRQRRDAATMMLLFRPLILALTETSRLDQAREVVIDALPLMRWFAVRGSYAPILALFALRRGRPDTAARLMAAGEADRVRMGARLELVGQHAQLKVQRQLASLQSEAQLSIWFREGGAISDEEFDRLVIEESARHGC
jgi:predicted ATPase/DNA-binding winged helix-turn-helix (wHTH) protein